MEAPFDNLGLPYHRHFAIDVKPLKKGEVAELNFDLLPIARAFSKGNRLRVTITCADKSHTKLGQLDPPPTVKVYRNKRFASYIILPIVEV